MANKSNGGVREDELYALVQRYGATTIFTLLHEISQAVETVMTIDWRMLVKATSTGISNAREYQMLWRHLAYGKSLENVEDAAEPLSDESDLEFELDDTSNKDTPTEVDNCVKVLLSSGSVSDLGAVVSSNVDAALTTDAPDDKTSVISPDKPQSAHSIRAVNCLASVSDQKQISLAGASNEGLDGNRSLYSGFPAKKKRKLWTRDEDMELIAAVEKFGEGNWATILKGHFKHDRTATQLSQRWAIIRKRQATVNQSAGSKSRSEEMLAAQKAFSMALDMPMSGSLSTILSGTTTAQPTTAGGALAPTGKALDNSQATTSEVLKQSQQLSNLLTPNLSIKPRTSQKKTLAQLKPSICPNPLIKAAAFAAGGRIATPSTAASLFKAAQSKTAVRIINGGGGSLSRSSTMNVKSPSTAPPVIGLPAVNLKQFKPLNSCQAHGSENVPVSNAERRQRIIISAVDVDELLAEEARGSTEKGDIDGSGDIVRELNEKGRAGDAITEGDNLVEEQSVEENCKGNNEIVKQGDDEVSGKKSFGEQKDEGNCNGESKTAVDDDSSHDQDMSSKATGNSGDKGFS